MTFGNKCISRSDGSNGMHMYGRIECRSVGVGGVSIRDGSRNYRCTAKGKGNPGVSTGTSLLECPRDDNRDRGGAKRSGKVRGFPYGFILFLFFGN